MNYMSCFLTFPFLFVCFKTMNLELVIVTGTSSGLGRKAALALLGSEEYHVIGAGHGM